VARKHVRDDEWFFPGHFPERPIMPGVIMVEALAQAGAVAVLSEPENRGKLALFAGIDEVRFKRIVSPGDDLLLTCEVDSARKRVGRGRVEASVDGEVAVRGLLTFVAR
jgi:3-hydroxyacyl-[acyl-carrier-protein] dehydratase